MGILTMLANSKSIVYGLLVAVLMGCLYFVFNYITSLQSEIALVKSNNVTLVASVETQQQTIKSKETEIKSIKTINYNLSNTIRAQDSKIKMLDNKFSESKNGNSRDLGKLAINKPKLISNAVNKGTILMNRCFEVVSGSKILENETNSECPELFKK